MLLPKSPRPAGLATRLHSAVGIALAAWAPLTVLAQQTADTAGDIEEVEVIGHRQSGYITDELWSSQYTAPLLDTARTINVITAEVMRDQATSSLADVLNNVPGISMQAGEGGTPAGDQLSIRGFSARTDIFVDGARDFGGYARDSYNLEQVEIAKGPGSNYTGRGATGGSINMVSKTARAENFITGSTGVGNASYLRGTLDANRMLGHSTAIRLNLLWHDAGVADRNLVENTRYGVAPAVAIGLGTATRIDLGYQHLQQDNVPDYGIPWVPAGNIALPGSVNRIAPVDDSNWYGMIRRDYEKVRNDMFTVRVEHDFNSGVTISNQFRWGETWRDSLITAPRFIAADSTDIRRTDWKSRDQTDRIYNNLTSLTMETQTGGMHHSLAAGLEFSDEYEVNFARDITGNQPLTDLFNPVPGDAWGGRIFRTGGRTESDGFSSSVYLADTITLNNHWLVTAGVRWDRFALDYTDTEDDGLSSSYRRSDSEFSYQASLVYKPADNASVYFGYGTSFNPSGEGLSLTTRGGDLAQVEPEQSRSFELGTKWELLDERLMFNAAAFHTMKTNARESDPVTAGLTVLSGKQAVTGVEIGAAGQLSDDWNLIAGYTYMHSEITETNDPAELGNELSNTPRHTFNLWTTYQVMPGLQVGAGLQYVDARFTNFNNERLAPAYHLLNAMAMYLYSDRLSFRVNASNLADADYLGNIGGGHAIPGEGRKVILSVNLDL